MRSNLPRARDDASAASHHRPSSLLRASLSVGGTGVWNRRVGAWYWPSPSSLSHDLRIIVLIVLVQTLVVFILVFKALAIERFSGKEIDFARNNMGCTRVSRLLSQKR